MKEYLIRRLLLVPLTLLGITFLVFAITRFLPGGPFEQKMQMMTMAQEGGRSNKDKATSSKLSEDQVFQLKSQFLLDKPLLEGYLTWVGVLPYEDNRAYATFTAPGQVRTIKAVRYTDEGVSIPADIRVRAIDKENFEISLADGSPATPWKIKPVPPQTGVAGIMAQDAPGSFRAYVYENRRHGVLQWDFGTSFNFGDDVWDLFLERFPISIFYGIHTLLITYALSIPLGIVKALKHRTFLDNSTSFLIFVGYAVPGYVFASVSLYLFAFKLDLFPTSGFVSENFRDLSFLGKVGDLYSHGALPICAYLIGSFAFTSLMMKNNLMDNLAADYVRTAIAKGASYRQAVIGHALRNSLIPIATTIGHAISFCIGGSFLIESIFDINGFGLLGLNSILMRDYPVVMATIFLSALLAMLGNILSDIAVAITDPRIRFK